MVSIILNLQTCKTTYVFINLTNKTNISGGTMTLKRYGNRKKPYTKEQIRQARDANDSMSMINMMYFNIATTKKVYPDKQ